MLSVEVATHFTNAFSIKILYTLFCYLLYINKGFVLKEPVQYRLLTDQTTGVRSPEEAKNFFPLVSVSRRTEPPLEWVPAAKHADHSPPSSTDIKNE
jgi:hypothetical protein